MKKYYQIALIVTLVSSNYLTAQENVFYVHQTDTVYIYKLKGKTRIRDKSEYNNVSFEKGFQLYNFRSIECINSSSYLYSKEPILMEYNLSKDTIFVSYRIKKHCCISFLGEIEYKENHTLNHKLIPLTEVPLVQAASIGDTTLYILLNNNTKNKYAKGTSHELIAPGYVYIESIEIKNKIMHPDKIEVTLVKPITWNYQFNKYDPNSNSHIRTQGNKQVFDINVTINDNPITFPNQSKCRFLLDYNKKFYLQKGDSTLHKFIQIDNLEEINNSSYEITALSNFPVIGAGTHYIIPDAVTRSTTGGWCSYYDIGDVDQNVDRPVIMDIRTSYSTDYIGYIYTHEQGYGYFGFKDVKLTKNVMYYNTDYSKKSNSYFKRPFRFKKVTQCETGTGNSLSKPLLQNQWEDANR